MGGKNTKPSEQIEIESFGRIETVDFLMNIFFITDTDMKKTLRPMINEKPAENEKIIFDRKNPIEHSIYKGFKYFYLEEEGLETIKDLIYIGFEKIKRYKRERKPNNNTFIIYLSKIDEKKIIDYLELFIEQEYSETEQPFILFLTYEKNINVKEKEKQIRNMIKNSSENYIKKKYNRHNEEKEKKLKELIPDEFFMHYNIFLIKLKENEEKYNVFQINKYLLKFASCYNEIGEYFSLDNALYEESINNENKNINNIIDDENNIKNDEKNIINENNIINEEENIMNEKDDIINNNDILDIEIKTDSKEIEKKEKEDKNNKKNEINNINKKDNIDEQIKPKSFNYINILCVGRTGSGKSTFINTFFDDRKCNIGESGGRSKTKRINCFSDSINHIRIYDTMGFEDSATTEQICNILKLLDVELINCNQKIHLILYFIQNKTNFQKIEYKVFNEIIKYKAHIIFIQTHCTDDSEEIYIKGKKKLFEIVVDIFKEEEKELKIKKTPLNEINDLRDLYANILLSKNENYILMNQKTDVSKKIFGYQKLYKAIYDYMKQHIINLDDISKIEGLFDLEEENEDKNDKKKKIKNQKDEKKDNLIYSCHPIFTLIKNNLFLHPYKTINDIIYYIEKEKKWIIAKNVLYASLSGFDPIPFVDIGTYFLVEKNLKKELAELYHFDLSKNIFLNDKLKVNNTNLDLNKIEKEKKRNNEDIIEVNKEKNEVKAKSQVIVNSGKGIAQSVKVGISIADVVRDVTYINTFKNAMNAFLTGCKSSIIFTAVGSLIGGVLNAGIIIYIGKIFSDYFEQNLIDDNGENFLKKKQVPE